MFQKKHVKTWNKIRIMSDLDGLENPRLSGSFSCSDDVCKELWNNGKIRFLCGLQTCCKHCDSRFLQDCSNLLERKLQREFGVNFAEKGWYVDRIWEDENFASKEDKEVCPVTTNQALTNKDSLHSLGCKLSLFTYVLDDNRQGVEYEWLSSRYYILLDNKRNDRHQN